MRRVLIASALLLVSFGVGSRAEAHSVGYTHSHSGYVQYTILEQFGVTATQLRQDYGYSQYWSGMWGVYDAGGSCYHSAFPTWTLNYCANAFDMLGGVDGDPRAMIEGDYDHSTGVSYTMYAEGWADWQGPGWNYCRLNRGSLPPFWSGDCYGGGS